MRSHRVWASLLFVLATSLGAPQGSDDDRIFFPGEELPPSPPTEDGMSMRMGHHHHHYQPPTTDLFQPQHHPYQPPTTDHFQPQHHHHHLHPSQYPTVYQPPAFQPPQFGHHHHQQPPPHPLPAAGAPPSGLPDPAGRSAVASSGVQPSSDKIFFPDELEKKEEVVTESLSEDRMMVRTPLRNCRDGKVMDKWGVCRQPLFSG